MPRRHSERDVVEDFAAHIVTEAHILESDFAVADLERLCPRLVLDLGKHLGQLEHRLHIGQRLLDLAVHEAEEIERDIELDQVGVDEHEIADGHGTGGDFVAGLDGNTRETDGDDRALADIQEREAGFALHRRFFVALARYIAALGLMRFVAEIFHRLVIE